jgi:hypothetical protein
MTFLEIICVRSERGLTASMGDADCRRRWSRLHGANGKRHPNGRGAEFARRLSSQASNYLPSRSRTVMTRNLRAAA